MNDQNLTLTEQELQEAVGKVFQRAQTDVDFRKLCVEDPNKAILEVAGKQVSGRNRDKLYRVIGYMVLEEVELVSIGKDAMSLAELRKVQLLNKKGNSQYSSLSDTTERQLRRWIDNSANGDEALFKKRLAMEGLGVPDVIDLFENDFHAGDTVTHKWTATFTEIIEAIDSFSTEKLKADYFSEYTFLDKNKSLAFEEVYLPVIELARKKLSKKIGKHHVLFSREAHDALENSLLQRLTRISAQTLLVEFNTYTALLQWKGIDPESVTNDATSRTHYLDFIKVLYDGRFKILLHEHVVLSRLISTVLDQWVETSTQLITRFHADQSLIRKRLEVKELGKVTELQANLSDSHNGGQSVSILSFESGVKIVYKPRDLGLEEKFSDLIDWVNNYAELDLKAANVINRDHYGWVEFVPNCSMETEKQVEGYFVRSGMLLGLIYLFGGVDFHKENIIANGEFPVLVDLETFIHPELESSEDFKELMSAASEKLYNSVMKSHYLPNAEIVNGEVVDHTALGVLEATETRNLVWKNVNTDAMRFCYDQVLTKVEKKNRASLNGNDLAPEEYLNQIKRGFEQIYSLFSEVSLNNIPKQIIAIFEQEARFLFRSTQSYTITLERACSPESLRSGIDFDIALDVLSQSLLTTTENPIYWRFLQNEVKMMQNFDVPYFTAKGNSNTLTLKDESEPIKCFDASPWEMFINKLKILGREDMECQLSLIEASMRGKLKEQPEVAPGSSEVSLDTNSILHRVSLIAKEIKKNALYTNTGEPSWILVKGVDNERTTIIEPIQHGLYDGALGVAVFFAALYHNTSEQEHRDFVYSTIALTSRWMNRKGGEIVLKEIGLGAASGIGSAIYSYVLLSDLLSDHKLLEEAELAASFLGKEHITNDETFDIIGGCSGTLLGLLSLYKKTESKDVLRKAIWCGDHLLTSRITSGNGFKVWGNRANNPAYTGFSHGASGIGYALYQLYEITLENKYREAALEAIEYENSRFDHKRQNWLDYRFYKDEESEFPFFTIAWCNGAPGIGLTRLGFLAEFDGESFYKDLKIACQTTLKTCSNHFDHLCCGSIGRAEVLLEASIKTGNPIWRKEAKRITSEVLDKAMLSFNRNLPNPTFFKGNAGLGYHLLRLIEGNDLPCVLSFES